MAALTRVKEPQDDVTEATTTGPAMRPTDPPPGGAGGLVAEGDEDLVARAASGERAAFEELFRRHARFVHGLAFRMLKSAEDAEDCAQEVWIKAGRGLDGYESRSGFRAWLGTITANHARDQLRGRERFRKVLQAAFDIHRYEEQRARDGRGAADHGSLVRAIRELEDLPREVIQLKLAEGSITLDEIGERLDLPRHKVKYAWGKALDALRRKMTEWGATDALAVVAWLVLRGMGGGLRG